MTPLDALYVPEGQDAFSEECVWRWYGNIPIELQLLTLSEGEKTAFESYYRSAGLLQRRRQPFFRHHYARPLGFATAALFHGVPHPRILDLGAGTGTQSLLFAILGAEVVAVDLDEVALSVLVKRKALIEERVGRPLAITVQRADAFEFDLQPFSPLTGLYSLFAFNMMQPSGRLLERLQPHFSARAAVAIQDGNRRHFFNRLFRPRPVFDRNELRAALARAGFDDISHVGGYALPPPFWAFGFRAFLEALDRRLARHDLFAVSYLHLARRGS